LSIKNVYKIPVAETLGKTTSDGAGVKLRRMFGSPSTVELTDPFLLLDHFGSNNRADYISGFPWHPHRGIETVTYLADGKVVHEDSTGNRGVIYPGDIQWMTAGSGIFHQEMPQPLETSDTDALLHSSGIKDNVAGFQLWINLPASSKMKSPVYRGIKGSSVDEIKDNGAYIKVIAGSFMDATGKLDYPSAVDPTYLDIRMESNSFLNIPVKQGYTSIVYSFSGNASIEGSSSTLTAGKLMIFSAEGEKIGIRTDDNEIRFIFLSGRPLREAVQWYGPIVMNTGEQIEEAFRELRNGTFIKEKNPIFQ
jgi:redox-sensitive bicupin YhaK (pirin superfamily)